MVLRVSASYFDLDDNGESCIRYDFDKINCLSLYRLFSSSPILVRKLGTSLLLPISRTGNEDYYASAVMNIILETDPSEWSVMYRQLSADTTLQSIENQAKQIKFNHQALYQQLTTQRDALFRQVNDCLDQLDTAIRQKNMSHSCPWI